MVLTESNPEVQEAGSKGASEGKTGRVGTGLVVYVAFLLVGNGCGWFIENSLWQTMANVPEVAQGGRMFGKVTLIIASVGLGIALLYVLLLSRGAMSKQTGQRCSTVLIISNVLTFVVLAFFWNAGAPNYPVFLGAAVFGSVIAYTTFCAVFPLISTYYGGWLIAPVRAGTDLSCLVTALLAEAQNPTGQGNLFPMWVLYATYAVLSVAGLVAWLLILKFGIGLREQEPNASNGQLDAPEQRGTPSLRGSSAKTLECSALSDQDLDLDLDLDLALPKSKSTKRLSCRQQLSLWLSSLRCPKQLILPVLCGVMAQVCQWSLVGPLAQTGAHMIDPQGCDGPVGREVYRISLTAANALVPVASLLSSLGTCPRWAFYSLMVLQIIGTVFALLVVAGVGQELWFQLAPRVVYMCTVSGVAGLEGYILTMAYRYIGDSADVPLETRMSASSLLSFLSNVVVNVVSITIGLLLDNEVIACHG